MIIPLNPQFFIEEPAGFARGGAEHHQWCRWSMPGPWCGSAPLWESGGSSFSLGGRGCFGLFVFFLGANFWRISDDFLYDSIFSIGYIHFYWFREDFEVFLCDCLGVLGSFGCLLGVLASFTWFFGFSVYFFVLFRHFFGILFWDFIRMFWEFFSIFR